MPRRTALPTMSRSGSRSLWNETSSVVARFAACSESHPAGVAGSRFGDFPTARWRGEASTDNVRTRSRRASERKRMASGDRRRLGGRGGVDEDRRVVLQRERAGERRVSGVAGAVLRMYGGEPRGQRAVQRNQQQVLTALADQRLQCIRLQRRKGILQRYVPREIPAQERSARGQRADGEVFVADLVADHVAHRVFA